MREARRPRLRAGAQIDLTGKVALITGGAGGLGRALARELKAAGADVVLWDLDPARGAAAAAETGARFAVVNAADRSAVRSAAAALGRVDVLINNAGVHARGSFLESSDDDARREIDVNLASYVWCTRAFLPGMIERGSGHLVWIASAAGLMGVPGMAVYSATKHAVVGLAESIRLELRRDGIGGVGTTIVCPSFIDTGMFEGSKPPRLTPWLEPGALARKIVAAVRADRLYLREPAMVKLVPLLKVFPVFVADALCALTGMDRSVAGPSSRKD